MTKGKAILIKTARFILCAALSLCLLAPLFAFAAEVEMTAVTDGSTLSVSDGAVFENVRFYNAGEIAVSAKGVTFENCYFYGENGVRLENAEDVSFAGCDFFGQSTAVYIKDSKNVSFEGCYFTECKEAIFASGTDFGYLETSGESGFVKDCFFYSCGSAITAKDSLSLSVSGSVISGSEAGISLLNFESLYITDTTVFDCTAAVLLSNVYGEISGALFYQNEYNVKSEAVNSVKIKNSASVETALIYPDDISYGVTKKDSEEISASDYKSRFTFNKEDDLEGFTDTAGVRVEVTGGNLWFEPDNNYIFLNKNYLYLNNRLFCRCEMSFSEKAELYGEVNLKAINNSPWINGGTNKIRLESENGFSFTSSLFGLLAPLKHAEWKLSLEGRFAVDYIAFVPEITLKAELVSENVIRVSLSGYSAAAFNSEPVINVSGVNAEYKTVLTGGTEAFLVFEKNISRAAKKITVSVPASSLSEPFASVLSGCDALGRSPEKEKEDFSLDSVQVYNEITLSSGVYVKKADLLPIVINVGVAVVITAAVLVLIYFLFNFLSKRNQIRKFAKKGRKVLKNRRRSNRF